MSKCDYRTNGETDRKCLKKKINPMCRCALLGSQKAIFSSKGHGQGN